MMMSWHKYKYEYTESTITNTQDYNSKDGEDGPDLPPLPVTGHSPRKWMTYKFHRMNGKR